jgi:hypothetical protein
VDDHHHDEEEEQGSDEENDPGHFVHEDRALSAAEQVEVAVEEPGVEPQPRQEQREERGGDEPVEDPLLRVEPFG